MTASASLSDITYEELIHTFDSDVDGVSTSDITYEELIHVTLERLKFDQSFLVGHYL